MDIGDFIALDNRPRAASFVAEIEAKIVEVGERPGSFQKRDDLHKGLRHARHGRYLIFFIKVDEEVQIVRVIEGSRDLPRLFEL
ncbi:Plasmid stabilization system [Sulfitobacter indolifex HEL-45]|uniref:Plasmid stabilization system n=2 Tax=Sulfitobacter indolifex TaxID=225422 RepID=A0ABP2D5E1_9RHOB|nr:Plasmid stabilization system [Sulfitobacter indolifex HEL-45]